MLLHQAMSGVGQRFLTNNTERMRITSGGYLLVGKTNTTFSNSGIELRGGNLGARFTRNYAEPIFVNRTGNDGDIIKFYGDTVELGAIGSEGGDSLYIQSSGSAGGGLRFHPSGPILPTRQGVTIDNAIDLGSTTRRFRNIYTTDLHLSNENTDRGGNEIDGTEGNWTIQEGEEHLYIINNKSGKKYRFALEEIE